MCCVCLTHIVCIQAVYILLKCVCNKKRTRLKKYVCLFLNLEFNLIFSDAVNARG